MESPKTLDRAYIYNKKRPTIRLVQAKYRKVDNLPAENNMPKGKPSSQDNRKYAWLGSVIRIYIEIGGP